MSQPDLARVLEEVTHQSPWDVFNGVLYDLCRNYPLHVREDEIAAKLVLIGRSYASALERGRKTGDSVDDFYLFRAAPRMIASRFDSWLDGLSGLDRPDCNSMGSILEVHKKLVNLFFEISGQEKRSLASKYLHFHNPHLFFIFDSQAEKAARKWAPAVKRRSKSVPTSDPTYHLFFERCLTIVESLKEKTHTALTSRQVDNLLLGFPVHP